MSSYPQSLSKYAERIFNNSLIPTIIPTGDKWSLSKANIRLLEYASIHLTEKETINYVEVIKNNKFIINVPQALFFSIHELLMVAYNAGLFSNILNEKPQLRPLRFSKERETKGFFVNYSYLKIESVQQNDFFCVEQLQSDKGILLHNLLMDYAVGFIGLHERAHIFNGHFDYIANELLFKNLPPIYDIQASSHATDEMLFYTSDQLTRHALELDADATALKEFIHRNTQQSYEFVYDFEFIQSKKDILYLSFLAIGLIFLLFQKAYIVLPNDPFTARPNIRLFSIIRIIRKIELLSEEEKQSACDGIITALQFADKIYHESNGIMISATSFRMNGDDDPENLCGSNAIAMLIRYDEIFANIKEKLRKYQNEWL